MNSSSWLRLAAVPLVLGFLLLDALAEPRFLKLRTGLVSTPDPAPRAARLQVATTDTTVVSGLYLIQFEGRLEPSWRAELRGRGVELLRYIPDDGFVADVSSNRLASLRALPYVRWMGPYEGRHKVHPRLVAALRSSSLAEPLAVKVLLSPAATGLDALRMERRFRLVGSRLETSLGRVLTGMLPPARLSLLAASREVLWIEPVPRMRLVDEIATAVVAGDPGEAGKPPGVHALGIDGRGVTVSVADSGIDTGEADFLHPDLAGRVDAFFAYGGLADASDEHSHGTHCAGIVAGNGATGEKDDDGFLYGLGVAPGAHLVAQRIFDGAGEYFAPPSYEQLTRDAVRSGASVGSNSWGDDTGGQYDLSAAEFDALVRDADALTPGEQQYILEFSAGNAGPGGQTIGSPAVGKNVIATGACENNRFGFGIYDSGQEVMADFSSRGPCEDGRIKPDITAPGTWIASVKSQFAGEENAWAPINPNYIYQGGTSQAGPHVSGGCALFVQWYRGTHGGATPSPALTKAALINSADDMGTALIPDGDGLGGLLGGAVEEPDEGGGTLVGDTAPVPNMDEGWGRMNLETLVQSERRFDLIEQGAGLTTGRTFERRVLVGAEDELKVTLAYTDVPGLPAAIPALVNDLDLEVVSPDGQMYRGNAFADGEGVAGTPEGDRVNNVEGVHLSQPPAGEWIVRVRAHNVVQDVHGRSGIAPEQDFALVISGRLPLPGEGVISWDREAYRAPTQARIRLVDAQLEAQASVAVRVRSGLEPEGLLAELLRSGPGGSFTGLVQLALGPAVVSDSILQVSEADEITVVYQDAAPPGERRSTAAIDSRPPVIGEVLAANAFGRTTITWLTDEPTAGRIYFGTTNALTNVVSQLGFRREHAEVVQGLEPETQYFFYVVATDAAGNVSTNNNDGRYHRFVGPKPASALLVYSPELTFSAGGLLGDTPYPGRETWTDTLDAIGLEYEVWDTSERGGAPRAVDLAAYRVVLWRPEELQPPTPGLLGALNAYYQGGGSVFIASYDLLSRLTSATDLAIRSNLLHVVSFDEDQGATRLTGLAGDPVGRELDMELDYSEFPSGLFIDLLGIVWENGPDHLHLDAEAAPVLLQEDGRVVGMRYPRSGPGTAGRIVFVSLGLEAVPAQAAAPNNRATLLGNVLNFLVPNLRDSSSVSFDQPAYTVPASVLVEVTDSRRVGAGSVPVLLETSATETRSVTLSETVRRGLFSGRVTLVPTNAAAGAGELRASHGARLQARYVDPANRASVVEVPVDTVAPVVTGVVTEPAYNEVIVSWETDKPTDALVRFGESPGDDSFLTRSAYSPELGTQHELLLAGLVPDRDYYFSVTSRDAAGNRRTDDAGGKLYKVRTLAPIKAPWSDDLEVENPGWVVFNEDVLGGFVDDDGEDGGGGLSGSGWQYGTPSNRHGITAASGSRCWATNLRGEPTDFAISDLISPAIGLQGGNSARLRFRHYYDFQDVGGGGEDDFGFGDIKIEAAQLAISTNNGATWTSIYSNEFEFSDDWEDVDIDISRHVGSVVRFRFNYQLFSFTAADRPGWFIDDVRVELNTVASTRIEVTNNLSQARFVIAGATNIAGGGRAFGTNLPPGTYTITWVPVPYYTTPLPQTNVLSTNGPLRFVGTYGFADVNRNGMSDAWESEVFGVVDPGRSMESDTDLDGAPDYAEFMAGTDPRNPDSALRLTGPLEQPNRTMRFEWPGSAGREYRLEISNDLATWTTATEPLRGGASTLSASLPALDPRLAYFFRLRVFP